MNTLRILTSLLLTVLPVAVLFRDWKFHDKRTKRHHTITRLIIIFWVIGSIAGTLFVWHDSSEIARLLERTGTLITQNADLAAKLDRYQADLDEKEQTIKELEKAALPRTLTERQKSELSKSLSFKSDFQVGLVCKAFDTEGLQYAKQISDVFQSASWQVIAVNQTFLDDIKSDLSIAVTDANQFETRDRIAEVFSHVGITCQADKIRNGAVSDIKPRTIYLIVGSKPRR